MEGDREQVRGVNSEKEEKDKSKVVAGVKGRKKKEQTLIQCKILLHSKENIIQHNGKDT